MGRTFVLNVYVYIKNNPIDKALLTRLDLNFKFYFQQGNKDLYWPNLSILYTSPGKKA